MKFIFDFLGWTKEDYIEFFKIIVISILEIVSIYIIMIGLATYLAL